MAQARTMEIMEIPRVLSKAAGTALRGFQQDVRLPQEPTGGRELGCHRHSTHLVLASGDGEIPLSIASVLLQYSVTA